MTLTINEVIPALEELSLEGKLAFLEEYKHSFAFDVVVDQCEFETIIHLDPDNKDYLISF